MKELKRVLKDVGWNSVILPRASIKPLQMYEICKGDKLNYTGELVSIFEKNRDKSFAGLDKDAKVSNIFQKKITTKKINFALSFLNSLIGVLGGGGINFAYEKATEISFSFSEVYENKIALKDLDDYLENNEVKAGTQLKKLLEKDKLHVIIATLKAKKIEISAKGQDQNDLKVDVDSIKCLLGTKLDISGGSKDNNYVISYESKNGVSVIFGFKSVKLKYDKEKEKLIYKGYRFTEPNTAIAKSKSPAGIGVA